MSISDGIKPFIFRRKMEKTRSVRKEMDGKLFFFAHQSCQFSFVVNMIKVLFHVCALNWPINNYVSHQGKGITRGSKKTTFLHFQYC